MDYQTLRDGPDKQVPPTVRGTLVVPVGTNEMIKPDHVVEISRTRPSPAFSAVNIV
jgi:hypothetical protein